MSAAALSPEQLRASIAQFYTSLQQRVNDLESTMSAELFRAFDAQQRVLQRQHEAEAKRVKRLTAANERSRRRIAELHDNIQACLREQQQQRSYAPPPPRQPRPGPRAQFRPRPPPSPRARAAPAGEAPEVVLERRMRSLLLDVRRSVSEREYKTFRRNLSVVVHPDKCQSKNASDVRNLASLLPGNPYVAELVQLLLTATAWPPPTTVICNVFNAAIPL